MCYNVDTRVLYAIKIVPSDCIKEKELAKKMLQTEFKHVVKFHEVLDDIKNIYIVMEYCNGSTLQNQIDEQKIKFNTSTAVNIIL
jgi:serine/threonine protein kinase